MINPRYLSTSKSLAHHNRKVQFRVTFSVSRKRFAPFFGDLHDFGNASSCVFPRGFHSRDD